MDYDNTTTSTKYSAHDIKPLEDKWYDNSPVSYNGTKVPRVYVESEGKSYNLLHRYTLRNGERRVKYNDWYYTASDTQPRPFIIPAYTYYHSCRFTVSKYSRYTRTWTSPLSSSRDKDGNFYDGADKDYFGRLGLEVDVYKLTKASADSAVPVTSFYLTYIQIFGRPGGYQSSVESVADKIRQGVAEPTQADWDSSPGYIMSYSYSLVYAAHRRVYAFCSTNPPNFNDSNIPKYFTYKHIHDVIQNCWAVYSLKYTPYGYGSNAQVADVTVKGSTDGKNAYTVNKTVTILPTGSACWHEQGNRYTGSDGCLPGMYFSACIMKSNRYKHEYNYVDFAEISLKGSACSIQGNFSTNFKLSGNDTLEERIKDSSCFELLIPGETVTIDWATQLTGGVANPQPVPLRVTSVYCDEHCTNAIVSKGY